jgi:peptidoglycan/LPS O-acetylase OafA/YrhL
MQPTHRYLSNLTPLRGIAALWVVVFHFRTLVVQFIKPERTLILEKGYLMVDLFFIMSGFIIYHVYQKSFQEKITAGHFRKFIVARFARVYPLHLFTLLFLIIFIAANKWWSIIDDPKAILPNLLLLHSFGTSKIFTWNIPSWSISAEWWAYMAFPPVALFIARRKKLSAIVLGLFVALVYLSIMFWIPRKDPFDPTAVVPHNLDVSYDFGFLRGLAGFVSGVLLYKIYEAGWGSLVFRRDGTAICIIIVSLLLFHFGVNDGFYIILFILLIYAFALNERKIHAICNFRPLQYLGKISYSIYLSSVFTFVVFGLVKLPRITYLKYSAITDFWTGLLYCTAFLILHIGISSLTYYFIEKPCRKYLNAKWGEETMPVYA